MRTSVLDPPADDISRGVALEAVRIEEQSGGTGVHGACATIPRADPESGAVVTIREPGRRKRSSIVPFNQLLKIARLGRVNYLYSRFIERMVLHKF